MPHPAPALNPADPAFVESLAKALPPGTLGQAEPRHLEEPRGRWHGKAGALARPRNTAEVAAILAHCQGARVGVVPLGGGTGLVSGQVLEEGPAPILLSLERMNSLRATYPAENVLIAEAGMTLAAVQEAAAAAGRIFPLTLASQGTARIGGCLATNAGGVNVLRYGNARALCLGIEAVLADGTVISGLKRLRKDNTGYDLRHLILGSEGTLAVITAAALVMHPVPAGLGTALFTVESPAAALDLLARAESLAAGCVSAFELISAQGLAFLAETMPEIRQPFSPAPPWMVLVELGLPRGLDPQLLLETLFTEAAAAGLVGDGVIAASEAQRQSFWALRESLPEANRRIGAISSHDISVPLSLIPQMIAAGSQALAELGDFRINCFGHVGDGNLHFNVFPAQGRTRGDYDALRGAVKDCVHDLVAQYAGSFSAEHGLGRLKVGDLERFGDPGRLAAMRAIKAALDPAGILNPGAVLRR